eukprot:46545-Pelagomonas_calceolata.AAC.6
MDVGSADRLAQHDLHIPKQYLFDPSQPAISDAVLVTPCPANSRRRDHSPHSPPGCVWDQIYCPHPGSLAVRKPGIDLQRSTKLAQKLRAHPVQYVHKLTSTRRAIGNKNAQLNVVP